MAVITISRQFGAGGRSLGQEVAQRLGYFFEDDAIIQEIAKKARVTPRSVQGYERIVGNLISRVITSTISRSYMERLTGTDVGYMDDDSYIEALTEVLKEFARRDKVVLVGRGGQYILRNYKNACHILLVAEKQDRIDFMKKNYDMSEAQAVKAIADGDRRRENLYARLSKTNYNDPHLYHICLNMSRIELPTAADLVCSLIQ